MKISKYFIICLFILATFNIGYAQNDCPPGISNWTTATVNLDFDDYGPGGSVDCQYNTDNNVFSIVMDWSTFQNNSDFISDLALKKLLEEEAVRNLVPNYPAGYSCDIRVYFQSACKVKVKTVMRLDGEKQLECCTQGAELNQEIYQRLVEGEVHWCWDVYNWQTCGYKCCARVYHCTRYYDNIWEKTLTTVSLPTTVSITSCDPVSGCTDCISGAPLPCEDGGCEGQGYDEEEQPAP